MRCQESRYTFEYTEVDYHVRSRVMGMVVMVMV